MWFTRSFLLAVWVTLTTAYPYGPPNNDVVCKDMTPSHGAQPQRSGAPYAIRTSDPCYTVGKALTVTIITAADAPMFKGFLVQARNYNKTAPLGEFKTDGLGKQTVFDCGATGRDNSISHSTNDFRNTATFNFTPSADYEKILFNATIVQSFQQIFINVTSVSLSNCEAQTTTKTTWPYSQTITTGRIQTTTTYDIGPIEPACASSFGASVFLGILLLIIKAVF